MSDEKQLVVKLALKASGYQQQIKSINQDTKLLNSEFEKAKSGSEDFEDSLEGQEAKLKLLSGELKNSESKLGVYNTQLKKCEAVLESATQAFSEQEEEVKSLREQVKDYSTTYGATSDVVKKLETQLKSSERALESKRKAVIGAESSLTAMVITVNKTEAGIGKLKTEVSKVDSELNEFKSGIGKADASMTDFKTGLYDVDEGLDKVGESLEKTSEDALEFGENMSEIGQGVTMVGEKVGELGDAITGTLTSAIETSNEFKSSINDMRAKLGLTTEQMNEMADVVEAVYNNNFGENFQDAAESVALVNKHLWLTGDELQSATEKAIGIKDTFNYDVSESIRSVDMLMKTFGLDADQAFNLIVQGSQQGLDFSGELLDTINEYSPQFKKAGLNAEDMFNILYDGTQSGAWNLDKIGDAVKEFNIRLTDGSKGSEEALASLGLNANEVAQIMSTGGESAKKTYQEIIDKIGAMDDKQQQNLVGVGLFGTTWEDLGPQVVNELSFIGDNFNKTIDSANKLNEVKYDDFGSALEGVKRNVETGLIAPIGDSLLPILNSFIPKLTEIVENLKGWIEENPKVVAGISIIVATIGILLTILSPIIVTIGMLVISIGAMSAAFASAGGAVAFFSATILPVIAVIGVVIAVIVTLYMAIKANWEGIKEATIALIETCRPQFEALGQAFNGLWEMCKSVYDTVIAPLFKMIGEVIQWCIEFVTPIIQRLIPVFTTVFNYISSYWNNIGKPIFEAIIWIIQLIGSIVGPVFGTFSDIICGAMDIVLKPIQFVIDKFTELFGWIGEVGSGIGEFIDWINPFSSSSDVEVNTKMGEQPKIAGFSMQTEEFARSGSYYQSNTQPSRSIAKVVRSSGSSSRNNVGGNSIEQLSENIINAVFEGLSNIAINLQASTTISNRELANVVAPTVSKVISKTQSSRNLVKKV